MTFQQTLASSGIRDLSTKAKRTLWLLRGNMLLSMATT